MKPLKKNKNEIKNKRTIRAIDHEDFVIDTKETGLPAMISPRTDDIQEELESMQGYKDYLRYRDLDSPGLNFGDY